jgi:hypothetical protein
MCNFTQSHEGRTLSILRKDCLCGLRVTPKAFEGPWTLWLRNTSSVRTWAIFTQRRRERSWSLLRKEAQRLTLWTLCQNLRALCGKIHIERVLSIFPLSFFHSFFKTDAGHPFFGFQSLNWGSQQPIFVSSIIETGIKYLLKIKIKIFYNVFLVSCLSLF